GDGRNHGFDIDDGSPAFSTPTAGGNDVGQGQLANRYGDGPFYMMEFGGIGGAGWGLQAFDRNGDRTWRFDPDIRSGATRPSVGPDGTIYFGWDGLRMSAVDPDGDPIWTRIRSQGSYAAVEPSPTSPLVVAIGGSPSQPWFAEARDAVDGDQIWEQALRDDEGANIAGDSRITVSPDGARMYFGAIALPLTPNSVFRVFAVRIEEPAPDCEGDTNGDNVVNFADLNAVLSAFGETGATGFSGADVNADGVVNFADLNAVLSAFGTGC
ncbi:MAG: dockerin type I domain-containing protein, partial [Phycisphaerales bacterium]